MYWLTLYDKDDRAIACYRVSGTASLDTIFQTAALNYPNVEHASLTVDRPNLISIAVGSIDVYDHPHIYYKE